MAQFGGIKLLADLVRMPPCDEEVRRPHYPRYRLPRQFDRFDGDDPPVLCSNPLSTSCRTNSAAACPLAT